MREATKEELEDEIWQMTRGALVQTYIDPWTGQLVRRDEGLVLASNKWGNVSYSRDELRQIRDWLRRRILIPVAPAAPSQAVIEPLDASVTGQQLLSKGTEAA